MPVRDMDEMSKTVVTRLPAEVEIETKDLAESGWVSSSSEFDVLAEDSVEATAIVDQSQAMREFQKAKDQDACLIMIRGPLQGQRFFLSESEMILGREPTADISIADPGISRRHARIVHDRSANHTLLVDLGSSNGTHVNGDCIPSNKTRVLEKEDVIRVGSSLLKYLPAGEYEILAWGHMDAAAHTDGLTGISNRRFFTKVLDAEFKRARALKVDLSLLCLDIDHFKGFNDAYGHDAGDYVLQELVKVISGRLGGEADVFARCGGEEFAVLFTGTSADEASRLADDLRQRIESHRFDYGGEKLRVTISVGVAQLARTTDSPIGLLKEADRALYDAKGRGRNMVVVSA